MSIELRVKQAKSISNRRNSEYGGISNRPGNWIMEVRYFQYTGIGNQIIGVGFDVGSDQRLSRQ